MEKSVCFGFEDRTLSLHIRMRDIKEMELGILIICILAHKSLDHYWNILPASLDISRLSFC